MADQFPDSIGLMWPVQWLDGVSRNVPDAHTTIMYLGEVQDVNFGVEEVVDALMGVDLDSFIIAGVAGTELFGAEQDIPVLRLDNPMLNRLQSSVEVALAAVGIRSASSFPDYKPHVTVDLETYENPPSHVLLSPAQVWYGTDRIDLSA